MTRKKTTEKRNQLRRGLKELKDACRVCNEEMQSHKGGVGGPVYSRNAVGYSKK